ncbi:Mitochondrial uncoupling protein 3 [Apostasia shenzhenica]|uniref:Mitochondrial uncoupling protein 3 n=1 Tax=Apostasia shenzhenica TaxID=1088818 RepID=A0A2I0BCV3_9ASPA|nr:Mitochondrial uncoupling protein 3 [Apostasia shenzhenica]
MGSAGGGGGSLSGRPEGRARTKIALTSLSAAVAETATFPIDIIKTRLQIQAGDAIRRLPPVTASASRVAADIWKMKGFVGFYDGLAPAVLRHLFYTPIRIVSYENLRHLAEDSVAGKVLAAGVSGVLAQVVASPADLIKVRMQADGRLVSNSRPARYTGIFDAFNKIARYEGIRGLWRGVFPNGQRAFLVNMGELSCYDQAKRLIIRHEIFDDNVFAHTLASISSGLCATTLSCPADVIKTRMMNQASGKDHDKLVYRNSYDCLMKTVKFEGVLALWKGFFPTWARLGPWQFVFWVSYERCRHAAGISSF